MHEPAAQYLEYEVWRAMQLRDAVKTGQPQCELLHRTCEPFEFSKMASCEVGQDGGEHHGPKETFPRLVWRDLGRKQASTMHCDDGIVKMTWHAEQPSAYVARNISVEMKAQARRASRQQAGSKRTFMNGALMSFLPRVIPHKYASTSLEMTRKHGKKNQNKPLLRWGKQAHRHCSNGKQMHTLSLMSKFVVARYKMQWRIESI
jgi:hypothetical protein